MMKRILLSVLYTVLFLAATHNALAVETPEQRAARETRRKELGQAGWFKPSYLDKWDRAETIPPAKAYQLYAHIPEYWATLYSPRELMDLEKKLPYFDLLERVSTILNFDISQRTPFQLVISELTTLAKNNPGGWQEERLREYKGKRRLRSQPQ